MKIERIAAFSRDEVGGNPAGVVLLNRAARDDEMARTAAEVGYSETAFAYPIDQRTDTWRVRYFAPEAEVPFCGHATIALGAVLGRHYGAGAYRLVLNDVEITVEAGVGRGESGMGATLTSPPTQSRAANASERDDGLALFALTGEDLDERLPPARIHAGADHLLLALRDRARLAAMSYDLDEGRETMRRHGFVTIMLVHIEDDRTFIARNAFASGGVVEDPATGAAAAAFAGYLRDRDWQHGGHITIAQGEDMGMPSLIHVRLSDIAGSPVQVSGQAHEIDGGRSMRQYSRS
jgi:PhzF family phenazine biosynthesis protein